MGKVNWRFYLKRSFIDPWHDPVRARLLLGTMIACFGAGLHAMYLNYSVAALGMTSTGVYHLARFILLGIGMIPLTYWLLSKRRGWLLVVLSELVGLCLLLWGADSPLWLAAGFCLNSGPFWALFSQRYACHQSHSNHANETTLLLYLMTLFAAAGCYVGGVFLRDQLWFEAILIGGAFLFLGTALLFARIPFQSEISRAWGLIHWQKPTTLLTYFNAFQAAALDFGLVTWMQVVGVTPLSAGLVLALRPVLGLVLTPLVGNLLQAGRVNLTLIGGVSLVIGWVLLIPATRFHDFLLPALVLITLSNNLIGPSEVSRWYRRRSAAGIIAREFLLMSGRLPSVVMTAPLVFMLPVAYPVWGLSVGALFTYGVARYSKKMHRSKLLGWGKSQPIMPQ